MPKMIGWDVFQPGLDGARAFLDTVFYDKDLHVDYVTDSLINHDGYPSDIIVEKGE